ncbi:hypothetical protein [Halomonas sp. DP8Y7-1]|nr:hypothetical protein [Halomonas sp. DP8Y7-1]
MIVTVIPMRVVQVAIDEVVDMIPMRHWFMTASGAMHMICGMA